MEPVSLHVPSQGLFEIRSYNQPAGEDFRVACCATDTAGPVSGASALRAMNIILHFLSTFSDLKMLFHEVGQKLTAENVLVSEIFACEENVRSIYSLWLQSGHWNQFSSESMMNIATEFPVSRKKTLKTQTKTRKQCLSVAADVLTDQISTLQGKNLLWEKGCVLSAAVWSTVCTAVSNKTT